MSKITSVALHQEQESKTLFGFWVYLMTDCVLFAALFATYVVLHGNTNGGASSSELFDLNFVLVETIILLASSLTCGLAVLMARRSLKVPTLLWLTFTFVLGAAFLAMEIGEFSHLVHTGNSWQQSGFLSAFFTLVGTHGLHIAVGLLWAIVLGIQIAKKGFTSGVIRRVAIFGLFWHFLDIVWIFIFTIVYLIGGM